MSLIIPCNKSCTLVVLCVSLLAVLRANGCFTDGQRRLDPASRAYLSPVVLSGYLVRKSPVLANKFTATFRIVRVYKSKGIRLRKRSEIVLQFWSFRRIPRTQYCGAASKSLVVDKKYFVFADTRTWDRPRRPENESSEGSAVVMSAYHEPVKATNKNRREIKGILCRRCAKAPTAGGLKNTSVKVRERLRLRCKVKGNPPPAVIWFKDGLQLSPSKRIRIRNKKKSSRLTVRHARLADRGRYECRAKNVVTKWPAVHSVRISVTNGSSSGTTVPPIQPTQDTTIWKFVGRPCPLINYCLNGGTCSLYEEIGEFVCQCAEGFKGPRCENKDLSEFTIFYRSSRLSRL